MMNLTAHAKCFLLNASLLTVVSCSSEAPKSADTASNSVATEPASEDSDSNDSPVPDSGDGSDGSDSSDDDTGQTTPTLPEYCSGALPIAVCDPALNLDLFWENSADIPLSTVAMGVMSLPFTLRSSEVDGGQIALKTIEGAFIDEKSFRLWFSEIPAGPALSYDAGCMNYFRQARGSVYWTQNPAHDDNDAFCHLGSDERVLYLNFDVCPIDETGECTGDRIGDYRFELRKNYSPY